MAYNFNQLSNLFSSFNPSYETKRQIVSVNGINDAKNFFLSRGENIILRDSNEDMIYVKSCDDSGKYTLKVYECKDITDQAISAASPVTDISEVTKELNELKSMIKELKDEHNATKSREWAQPAESVQSIQRKAKS